MLDIMALDFIMFSPVQAIIAAEAGVKEAAESRATAIKVLIWSSLGK
jgi:hypothetical protein